MARLSEMVDLLEKSCIDNRPTLDLFARRLREAGRISKAKRGRGAAEMTYLDAARLLIAVFATDRPERAVDAEATFSATLVQQDEKFAVPSSDLHGKIAQKISNGDLSLDHAVAALLEYVGSGAMRRSQAAYADGDEHKLQVFAMYDQLEILFDRSNVLVDIRGQIVDYRFETIFHREMAKRSQSRLQSGDLLNAIDAEMAVIDAALGRFKNGKNIYARAQWSLLSELAALVATKSSYA